MEVSMQQDIEKRIFNVAEFRAVNDSNGVTHLTGYAALFNVWSLDLGGWIESIEAGAFTNSLKVADVRALFNHDPNYVLGRNTAGTLTLEEDQNGLKIDIIPPDTQYARDLVSLVKRGDVNQMSFQFRTLSDDVSFTEDTVKRVLKEVELIDVAVVTFPAYPQTSVQLRSRIEGFNKLASELQVNDSVVSDKQELKAQFNLMRKKLDLVSL